MMVGLIESLRQKKRPCERPEQERDRGNAASSLEELKGQRERDGQNCERARWAVLRPKARG